MNASNAKDYLPLVQALSEGKVIQVTGVNGFEDIKEEVSFCFAADQYRIKPEPREIWVNHYADRVSFGPFDSLLDAASHAKRGAKITKYREVLE